MKKSILFLMAAAGLSLTACQNFKKAEGGLEYKYLKEGSAEKAEGGDVVVFHFTISSDRDSVLMDSYQMGLPQAQRVIPDSVLQQSGQSYPGDMHTIFRMLGEGDSAIFRLNLDTASAHLNQPKPEFADKYIQYAIKVEKVFKQGDLTDSLFDAQVNEYFEAQIEGLKNAEESRISKYIEKHKLQPKKTASGLQYVIKEEGSGAPASVGDTVRLNYIGKLAANEKIFDTNQEDLAKKNDLHNPMRTYEPISVRVGKDPVIQGWTEALQLLNKGSKATLIIPSGIGYGQQGFMGEIPPYAPLIFDVEVLDIIEGPADEEEVAETPLLPGPLN